MTDVYLAIRDTDHEGADLLGVFATAQSAMERLVAHIKVWRPSAVPDVSGGPEDFEYYDGASTWSVERWTVSP